MYLALFKGSTESSQKCFVMAGVGLVMAAVFASIWFGPWRGLQQAVMEASWAQGAKAMNEIRQRVMLNLILGTLTVALATLGLAF